MSDAETAVDSARHFLSDFEELSVEEQHGAIEHAENELRNARRALPEDY